MSGYGTNFAKYSANKRDKDTEVFTWMHIQSPVNDALKLTEVIRNP